MSRSLDWRSYIDERGDFELASYLHKIIMDLMKQALDMGTLLSDDPAKLRAFKEQTKNIFKKRWLEVAQALESFDIITPCICAPNEFCRICGGSRYRLSAAMSPDQLREMVVIAGTEDPEMVKKLQKGLQEALDEVSALQR